MAIRRSRIGRYVLAFLLATWMGGSGCCDPVQTSQTRFTEVLENIATLDRPGQEGLATIWDGNKYVQCRRMPDHAFRCEAAGTRMQPSLRHVLNSERIARLERLGWRLDPNFGNYTQTFSADLARSQIAEKILQVLSESYDADIDRLEVQSDWIRSEPCPPRNGPGQNLAGLINDATSMRGTSIHDCVYTPAPEVEPSTSAEDLITKYQKRLAGEIQRLKVNIDRRVFVVLDTTSGYVQCQPQISPKAIYCEAQSADNWPMLANVLTAERVARLHAVGFADPGRAPNYWKTYPIDTINEVGIARELLSILFEVYAYRGSPELKFRTEKGRG